MHYFLCKVVRAGLRRWPDGGVPNLTNYMPSQAEQKELSRGLQARIHVHERRMSAELGRWQAEADRADALAGRIGAAENERDAAIKRLRGEVLPTHNIIVPFVLNHSTKRSKHWRK